MQEPLVLIERERGYINTLTVTPCRDHVEWLLESVSVDGTKAEERRLTFPECEEAATFLKQTLQEKGYGTFDLSPQRGGRIVISTFKETNTVYLDPRCNYGISLGLPQASELLMMLQELARLKRQALAAALQPVFGL